MLHVNPIPMVFIISLASSIERRGKIRSRLEQLGMAYEFVDGIDLRNTDIMQHPRYDSVRRRLCFGRDLQPGELGCLLSHRKVYEIMVTRAIPHALVLEDDASLEDDLPQVLASLIRLPISWDLVRFLDKKKVYRRKCRRICMIDHVHELSRLPTNSGGAYGYLLNQRGAARLLELMEKNWLQNDVLHSRAWMTGLEVFIVRPSPVRHDNDMNSTIGDDRFDRSLALRGAERWIFPWKRFRMQIQDKLAKRWHYLMAGPRDRRYRRLLDAQREGGEA